MVAAANGQNIETQYDIHIPALRADVALKSLARQTETPLLFSYDLAQKVQANPVLGRYTLSKALELLLQGTGLSSSLTKGGVITVTSGINAKQNMEQDMNYNRKLSVLGSIAAFFGASVLPHALHAEETKANDQLTEIVVTAEKREERLQDVPNSISVLTAEQAERYALASLSEYQNYIPGLYIAGGDAPGSGRIILRGLNDQGSASPLVATYIDNLPVGASTGGTRGSLFPVDLLPYDLDRIEVLRGPQGTLYGASTMGGLVKYVLKEPDLNQFQAQVGAGTETLDYGSGLGRTFRAAVSGPIINDTLGFRVSGFDRWTPGFIDNVGLGIKDENDVTAYGGRLAILAKPADDIKIEAWAMVQQTQSDLLEAVTLNTTTFKPVYGPYTINTSRPDGYSTRSEIYALTVEWKLGFATLSDDASISRKNDVYTWDLSSYGFLVPILTGGAYPSELLGYRFDLDLKKWTEELRLTSSSNQRVQWMVGFFSTGETTTNAQLASAYTPEGAVITNYPDLLTASYPGNFREAAGFGNVTYTITDQLDVSAGLRYAHDTQDDTQFTSGLFAGSLDTHISSESNSTTWSFSSRYHFTPDDMLYVRIANGYRPGAPNATYNNPAVPPTFAPDKLVNYEVGFKGSLLDGRLIIDDSIFYIDWKNIQVPQETVTNPPLAYTGNAGSAVSQGTELAANYHLTQNLSAGLTFAYTDAHITQDAPTLGGKNGDPLPGAPKIGGSAMIDYSRPLNADLSLALGGSYHYRGSIWTELRSAPGSLEFPSTKRHIDLYAGGEWKRVTFRIYAKNVLGEQSYDGTEVPFTNNGYIIDPPRTIGISVDARL